LTVQEHLPAAVSVTNRVARTFSLSIRFLPPSVRGDIYLLYLVCRTLDDLADGLHPQAEERIGTVRRWAVGGLPACRESEILAHLCGRYPAMPREAVVDFCDGQLRALEPIRIETEEDLDHYSYQVAGTVGRLMASILGARGAAADTAARALGIAMQRTNILRDLDEDLAQGQAFIPRATLKRFAVTDLRNGDRAALLRTEIAIADGWYEEGLAGVGLLQRGGWQVRAAALMYREILRRIEADGLGSRRPHRAAVPARHKLRIMSQSLLQSGQPSIGPAHLARRRSSVERVS
jgi:phytoene synthase